MSGGPVVENERRVPWLNPGDRMLLIAVAVLLLALLAVHYAAAAGLGRPRPTFELAVSLPSHQVDINSAPEWELAALRGVGPTLAAAIVRVRTQRNGFRSTEELTEVPGIGPKILAQLTPHVTAGGSKRGDEKRR